MKGFIEVNAYLDGDDDDEDQDHSVTAPILINVARVETVETDVNLNGAVIGLAGDVEIHCKETYEELRALIGAAGGGG